MDALWKATAVYELVDKASRPVRAIRQAVDGVDRLAARAGRTWDGYAERLDRVGTAAIEAGGRLSDMGDKFQRTGRGMMLGGAALAAPILAATKAAMDYETALTGVAKAAGVDKGTAEYARMSDQVRELTRLLPLAHEESAAIFEQGARAGLAGDVLADYASQVGSLSVAWDMAAGDVGEAVGKIAAVYRIPISEMGRFGDVVNWLDDSLVTTAPEILDFTKRIAGTAGALGLAANEAAVFGGIMTEAGEVSSRAATSLETALIRMQDPFILSKTSQAGFERLGLLNDEFRTLMRTDPRAGLIEFLDRLEGAGADATSIASLALGMDSGPAVMKLVNNLDKVRDTFDQMDAGAGGGGVMAEVARQSVTAGNAVKLARAAVVDLGISFGEDLLPHITPAVHRLAAGVRQLGAWIDANPKLAKAAAGALAGLAGLTVAVGALTWTFGGLFRVVGGGMKGFGHLAKAVAEYRKGSGWLYKGVRLLLGPFRLLVPVLKGVALGFRALTLALVSNPIVAAALAVAGIAYLIWRNWDSISPKLKAFWDGVTAWARLTWMHVVAVWRGAAAWFSGVWAGVKSVFASVGPYVLAAVAPVLGVPLLIARHWDTIVPAVSAVWARVRSTVSDFLGRIKDVILGFDLFSAGKALMDNFIGGVRAAGGLVVGAVDGVMSKVAAGQAMSPVRRGPLTVFNNSGHRLMELFASTVSASPAVKAVDAAFGQIRPPRIGAPVVEGLSLPRATTPAPGPSRAGGTAASAGDSVAVTVNVTVGGVAGPVDARAVGEDVATQVRREIEAFFNERRRRAFA